MSSIGNAIGNLLSNPLSLIGAASPFIVNAITSHSASLAAEAKERDAEQANARDLVKQVTETASQVAYYNQEALYGIMFRGLNVNTITPSGTPPTVKANADDVAAWEGFRIAWRTWRSSALVWQSRIKVSFGPGLASLFGQIDQQFIILTNMVNAAYFLRPGSKFFIKDALGAAAPGSSDPWEVADLSFLIAKLSLDDKSTPDLVAYLGANPKNEIRILPEYQVDFRYKYMPVLENLDDDIEAFNEMVLDAVQSGKVGKFRLTR
jgi:hypothetical protein